MSRRRSVFADVPVAVLEAVELALAVGQPGHVGVVARPGEVTIEGVPDAVAGELLGVGFVADLYVRGLFRWRDATVADAAGMS